MPTDGADDLVPARRRTPIEIMLNEPQIERGGEGFLTHAAEARLRAERDRLAAENKILRDWMGGFLTLEEARAALEMSS